jgi:hypothetical protein
MHTRKTLPPGAWWKAPLILGPALWFGLPIALLGLMLLLAALWRSLPGLHVLAYLLLPLNILVNGLFVGMLAFTPALPPAMAFSAWLLRSGRLSWLAWSLGPALFAAALGAGFAALVGSPAEKGIVPVFALCFGIGGLVYGLAFRGLLGLWLRHR